MMNKKKLLGPIAPFGKLIAAFPEFLHVFAAYLKGKLIISSFAFEKNKNILVKFFMIKRGRYSRPFLHFATMGVLTIGVIVAPFLATTYPVFSQNGTAAAQLSSPSTDRK